jgi:putative peptidoglycan lipid II flippase
MISSELSSTNKIGQATITIAIFALLAKILGLVREIAFAHEFGISGDLVGSYFAAFRIPDFIYNLLILGTFSVAFIPIYSEYLLKDKKEADELASSILNTTLLGVFVLSLLAFIFVDPLLSLIVPGFSPEARELTKLFTKVFLLSPIFLTLSSIISSMLNTRKSFLVAAAAPVFYNASIIFGILVLYPWMGSLGIALGVVLGAFLMFAIQVPKIFQLGFVYQPIIKSSIGYLKFWKLYWPRIFSMGTEPITALIVTIFGSYIGTKALAGYYYANNLQSLFLGVIAISFAIAVFPILSDLFNKKEVEGFKDVLAKTTIQILYFIMPLSILLLVLRAQAVRLIFGIFQSTSFDFEATRVVAQALGLFCISLFAQGLVPLFTRAFYAMQNTVIPVFIGFITIGFSILLSYYLIPRYGLAGMALAFSITSIINLSILIMELHYKIGNIRDEYLIVNVTKIIISAILAGSATYVSLYILAPMVDMSTYFGVLTQAVVSGLVGIGIYLGISSLLGLAESQNLVKLLRTTAAKIGRPINTIWNK